MLRLSTDVIDIAYYITSLFERHGEYKYVFCVLFDNLMYMWAYVKKQ